MLEQKGYLETICQGLSTWDETSPRRSLEIHGCFTHDNSWENTTSTRDPKISTVQQSSSQQRLIQPKC